MIITTDVPIKPQQEIVYDVSILQTASTSKSSKPAKESQEDKAVREFLQDQCNQIASWCRAQGAATGGGSRSSGIKLTIQREITNYLMSVNHPMAMKMLQEFKEEWKNWK